MNSGASGLKPFPALAFDALGVLMLKICNGGALDLAAFGDPIKNILGPAAFGLLPFGVLPFGVRTFGFHFRTVFCEAFDFLPTFIACCLGTRGCAVSKASFFRTTLASAEPAFGEAALSAAIRSALFFITVLGVASRAFVPLDSFLTFFTGFVL